MLSHGNSRRRVVISLAALVDLLFVAMFLEFVELQRVAAEQNKAAEIAKKLAADANSSKAEAVRNKEKAEQAEADAVRYVPEGELRAELAASPERFTAWFRLLFEPAAAAIAAMKS